ncbi:MAG TPA: PAS domain S-box protein, partial [Planctomycetota bacterium]|nr:PAS domain S-box protein [Planctomycetota bacterium]
MKRVVELIRKHRDEIIARWLADVRALPSAAGLSRKQTVNSLPLLLDEILGVLERDAVIRVDDRAIAMGEALPLETPPLHSRARVLQGYHLSEVVTEYRVLRRTLLDFLNSHLADEDRDMRRRQTLHEAIDLAIGECVETYRRAREEERERLVDELQAVIDQMPTGVFIIASERRVTRTNRKADEILGRVMSADHDVYETTRLDGSPYPFADRPISRALRGETVTDETLYYERPDGARVLLRVSAAPIRDRHGRTIAAIATFDDVTREREAQEALRAREEVLRLAIEGTGLGTWDWDLARDELRWAERTNAIFGLEPAAPVSYRSFLDLVHPEDRARIERAVERAIDPAVRAPYDEEYRIATPAGEERWINSRGKVLFDDADGGAGRPLRFVGTGIDVTERKRAEAERERLLAELRESLQARDDFINVASHELKTPLTALSQRIQAATLALRKGTSEEALAGAAKALENAMRSVESVDRLVEALLDTARIRAGRLVLQ